MKYLIISSWNTSVAAAWIARSIVQRNLDGNKFVILCPPREDSWAEDHEPTDAHPNVRIHHFNEDLVMEDGQPFANTGLPVLDFVLLQLVFYAKTYEIDKIIVIGSFFQNFSILARYALLEEKDKPAVGVRAIVTHPGLQMESEFKDIIDIQNAVEKAYGVLERLFHTNYSSEFMQQYNLMHSIEFDPHIATNRVIPATMLSARAHLKDVVKMALPAHSFVLCCFHSSDEVVMNTIERFKSMPKRFTDNDRTLLWIVQMNPKRSVYEAVREESNIIYTYTRLATDVVYAIVDACDSFIGPDDFFKGVITTRGKTCSNDDYLELVERGRVHPSEPYVDPIADFEINILA